MGENNGKGNRARELFAEEVHKKANSGWQYNRNLLETSVDSLVVIRPDGIITDVNHATEEATGLLRDKIIGTEFSQYFTEPDKARAGYQQVFEKGKVVDYELCLKNINGPATPVSYNSAVYKDDKGQIVGVLAAARDISAIKKHEVELIESNNDLELIVRQKTAELLNANKELALSNEENDKREADLLAANKELAYQSGERADRAAELVITNRELKRQKAKQKEIEFMSYHDLLTGLYNRRFYEEELRRLDTNRNLPLTLVMGDVNGLKLINDCFGHAMGDELLKKVAEVIKRGCRTDDIIARIGGDEFVILLPKTSTLEAERIVERISDFSLKEKVCGMDISISFGYKTKTKDEEEIAEIFKNAENHMYSNKRSIRSTVRGKTIDLVMNTLYKKSSREKLHSIKVSEICEAIATKMDLSKIDVNQIKIAGLLHDIGKIEIDEKVLNKPKKLSKAEWEMMQRHPEIGYRILSSVNEFSVIADDVLEHQERWDGKGYPRGLKGEESSLHARIITVADAYNAMTTNRRYGKALSEEEAIKEIKKCSGTQFDPAIAQVLIKKVLGKEWESATSRA